MAETNINKSPGKYEINKDLTVDTNTFHVDASTNKVGVGTTEPSQKLEVDGTLKATSVQIGNVTNSFFPYGAIVIWSGDPASLPTGWVLCDGTNSTPDLRDKFVINAGNTYTKGASGGTASINLTNTQLPAHRHYTTTSSHSHAHSIRTEFGRSRGINYTAINGQYMQASNKNAFISNHPFKGRIHNHVHYAGNTGGNSSFSNIPPYYALAFIMKT
jgi:microcystin-dependent protein